MGQGLHAFAASLASAVLALSSAPALAVQPAPLVTPAGQVELARLVDLAAQRLSLNIEYDASALRGSATLRLDAGLSDAELWTLTNRVLASRGFTTVRAPGDAAYSVVRLADAAAAAPITRPADPHEDPHATPPRVPPPGLHERAARNPPQTGPGAGRAPRPNPLPPRGRRLGRRRPHAPDRRTHPPLTQGPP